MFKLSSNKSFTQQRAILKPIKNVAFFEEVQDPNGILERVGEEEEEEEEEEDVDEEEGVFMDDGSSCYSNQNGASTRNDTMLLAQFLSTTGPEACAQQDTNKKQQQFNRASRLLSRLRKRPTTPALRSGPQQPQQPQLSTANNHHYTGAITEKKNYIPLPVYDSLNNHSNNNCSIILLPLPTPLVRITVVVKTQPPQIKRQAINALLLLLPHLLQSQRPLEENSSSSNTDPLLLHYATRAFTAKLPQKKTRLWFQATAVAAQLLLMLQ
jgi:hypothetical protein